jgi:hypothetical protein
VNGKLVDTTNTDSAVSHDVALANPALTPTADTGVVTKVGLAADQEAHAKLIIDKYVHNRQVANGITRYWRPLK